MRQSHIKKENLTDIFAYKGEVDAGIRKIADNIIRDYPSHERLKCVTVLYGGERFSEDLLEELSNSRVLIDNQSIILHKSRSGEISILKKIHEDLQGRDVIAIDDFMCSGKTAVILRDYLFQEKKINSMRVAVLLDKPSKREADIRADYKAFDVPEELHVFGRGTNYKGVGRLHSDELYKLTRKIPPT